MATIKYKDPVTGEWKYAVGASADCGIKIEDDGEGNVTITTASGGKINITDDGNGMAKEMKTLNGYEIVDAKARSQAEACQKTVNSHAVQISELKAGNSTLTDAQLEKCKEYAGRLAGVGNHTESFVFFTDPHFGGSTAPNASTEQYLRQIAEVYNRIPASMCVCGGDWLNNSNTKENACWQLGVYDGLMKKLFDRYVMVLGNHDTNYQGYDYMESGKDGTYDLEEHQKCMLSRDASRALWYRTQGEAYFTVDGGCTKFYVFDTQLDWYSDMDAYKWEQIAWFAASLLEDQPEHCAALLHIAGHSAAVSTPFIKALTQAASAYNSKTAVTLNGITYDFSGTHGTFHFILGGHTHSDLNFAVNGIPVAVTTNARVDFSTVTFDLVLADYDNNRLHMVRVGAGSDRLISLTDGSLIEDGNTEDGGDEEPAVENLFDIGTTSADYVRYNGKDASTLTVNAAAGVLTAPSESGSGMSVFRRTPITNDGSTYTINFTVSNDVNLVVFCSVYIRAFDNDGNVITEWGDTTFTFSDYWNAFYFGKTSGNNPRGEMHVTKSFTLPEHAATFQIGFGFTTPYQGEHGTLVTFRDIALTKA